MYVFFKIVESVTSYLVYEWALYPPPISEHFLYSAPDSGGLKCYQKQDASFLSMQWAINMFSLILYIYSQNSDKTARDINDQTANYLLNWTNCHSLTKFQKVNKT